MGRPGGPAAKCEACAVKRGKVQGYYTVDVTGTLPSRGGGFLEAEKPAR